MHLYSDLLQALLKIGTTFDTTWLSAERTFISAFVTAHCEGTDAEEDIAHVSVYQQITKTSTHSLSATFPYIQAARN